MNARLQLLKMLASPFKSLFGSGIGNNRWLRFLARWTIYVVIPKQSITLESNGCKLQMDIGGKSGIDSLASGILMGNGYEIKTTEIFKTIVKPNMNVIDIGAHIGYYALLASRLVGKGGNVWAFEPEPKNYANLIKNTKLNEADNVSAIQMAVSDKIGEAKFYISDDASGECSLIEISKRSKKYINVAITTLDSVMHDCLLNIDIIKIDVDGGEIGVLNGAKNILRGSPKIFTEFWKPGLEGAGYSCDDYWNELQKYGYQYIYLIDERKFRVYRVTIYEINKYLQKAEGVNLLCSKEELYV